MLIFFGSYQVLETDRVKTAGGSLETNLHLKACFHGRSSGVAGRDRVPVAPPLLDILGWIYDSCQVERQCLRYFTQDFIDFFTELAFNNEKLWFEANRKRYIKNVKEPFEKFTEDLITEIKKFDTDIQIEPKKAIYRINRDVRFAKDKTPYKTYASVGIGRIKNDYNFPGYTLGMGVENGLSFAGGLYSPDKEVLVDIRRALMDSPEKLSKLVASKKFIDAWGDLQGEKNKILPPEFKEAAKDNEWLFYKQWVYWKGVDFQEILQDDLLEYVIAHFKAGYAVNTYFKKFSY